MKTLVKSLSLLTALGLLAGCNIFLGDEGKEGMPCQEESDCKEGLICVHHLDGKSECAPKPLCAEPCPEGTECQETTNDKFLCVPHDRGHEGQPCMMDNTEAICVLEDAGTPLECIHPDDFPYNPPNVCVPAGLGDETKGCYKFVRDMDTLWLCKAGLFCFEEQTCVSDAPMCIPPCNPDTQKCLEMEAAIYDCVPKGEGEDGQGCVGGEHCRVGLLCIDEKCQPDPTPGCNAEECATIHPDGVCEKIDEETFACFPPGTGHLNEPCSPDSFCILPEIPGQETKCLPTSMDEGFCVPWDEGDPGQRCTAESDLCAMDFHCIYPYQSDVPSMCVSEGTGADGQPCYERIGAEYEFFCDGGLSCDSNGLTPETRCVLMGSEGSYCDDDHYPCDEDPELQCINNGQADVCVPNDQGTAGQHCWRGQCEAGHHCVALQGWSEALCIPEDAASMPGQRCYLGSCVSESGLVCLENVCILPNANGEPCTLTEHCSDGNCDYILQLCNDQVSDFGQTCSTDNDCVQEGYGVCATFWAGLKPKRCSTVCVDYATCEHNSQCLLSPVIDPNGDPLRYCGLPEWSNYYGMPCENSSPSWPYPPEFVCKVFDTDFIQGLGEFLTTACPADCPPGWECCAFDDGSYCAPASHCGFYKDCTQDNCTQGTYDVCSPDKGVCTKSCTGDYDCPPGANCTQATSGANECRLESPEP